MPHQKPQKPEMTDLQHSLWRTFIEKKCGLDFGETRIRLLCRCLWERMQIRQMGSYSDYYYYMLFNPNRESEWNALLELLVNHETCFFRHGPSFEILQTYALPHILREKARRGDTTVALWSAGCSTGEETYSLGMAALETAPAGQVHVLGSDISDEILERASAGRYKRFVLRSMPTYFKEKYLTVVEHNPHPVYKITDAVRSIVTFSRVNLIDSTTYPDPPQDVIFCQNVLIYFKPEQRTEIVNNLCRKLQPGGFLFPAPGEVIGLKVPGIKTLRLDQMVIYQKGDA